MTSEIIYKVSDKIEPVVRYETFSPSQTVSSLGKAETIAVNYYMRDYLTKVQLAASALQNMIAVNGTPVFASGANNHEITIAVQTAI